MAETSSNPADLMARCLTAATAIHRWSSDRGFAGHEPYDLLNSRYLSGLDSSLLAPWIIHFGRRVGGLTLRKLLKVPPSRNPKALALFISGLVDLDACGMLDVRGAGDLSFLSAELLRLRSSGEEEWCWGYDWHFRSFRGSTLPRFAPNSIVTTFAGEAFLDLAEHQKDEQALDIARSAGRFLFTRLNRPVNDDTHLCLSYTPADHTEIFNSSALAAAFQARVNQLAGADQFTGDVERALQFLADGQRPDGSWPYGTGKMQQWIDHFHTGYDLSALARYRHYSASARFDQVIERGFDFYTQRLFTGDGVPKYFHDRLWPIDIHSCTQAIVTFCDLAFLPMETLPRAGQAAEYLLDNMYAPEGTVYYQKRRYRTDRTPYMRWGQAWAFRSLARLVRLLHESATSVPPRKVTVCAE